MPTCDPRKHGSSEPSFHKTLIAPVPNLENLRKQAKRYLRWHRDGYHPVAAAAEIKRLFLECRAAGVDLHQPLRTEPWGARTFIVQDPDGNLLLFAGPASDPAAPDDPGGPDEPAP